MESSEHNGAYISPSIYIKVTRPTFFGGGGGWGYHPTLKLSGIPPFTLNG